MSSTSVPDTEELLSPRELFARFKIPLSTSAAWRCLGKGPKYVKLQKSVRYRLSDVRAWLDANTHDPSQRAAVAQPSDPIPTKRSRPSGSSRTALRPRSRAQ
jgi:predicted DNA-binding transcriptional regulator AlpA